MNCFDSANKGCGFSRVLVGFMYECIYTYLTVLGNEHLWDFC